MSLKKCGVWGLPKMQLPVEYKVESEQGSHIFSPVCSGPHSNVAVSNFQGSNCGKCAGFDRRRVQALLYDQL